MKIFFYFFITLIAGCASSIPIVSESDAVRAQLLWKDISLEQLRSDRELYIVKCSGCHSLYKPSFYSRNEWMAILPIMNSKSKLTAVESEQIKRYLSLFSSEKPSLN